MLFNKLFFVLFIIATFAFGSDFSQLENRLENEKEKDFLSQNELKILFENVSEHPVATLNRYNMYDPHNQGIGFCFGRAMTVHLEAMKMGLKPSAIHKMWIYGELQTGDAKWWFHVTTMVRGEDQRFYTIDPITDGPMDKDDWLYEMYSKYDPKKTTSARVTDPFSYYGNKEYPEMSYDNSHWEKYNDAYLFNPYFNSYFRDLLLTYADSTTGVLKEYVDSLLALDTEKNSWDLRRRKINSSY